MPRFFMDLHDGEICFADEEGSDLACVEQAREQALALLPQVMHEALADGTYHEYCSTVRDESGQIIYRATLSFRGEDLEMRHSQV